MDAHFSWQWVQAHVGQSMEGWRASAGESLAAAAHYDPNEQKQREAAYDREMRAVECELRDAPRSGRQRAEVQDRIIASFARFSATALSLEPEAVRLLTQDFLPSGRQLAQWATRFDPSLSKPDMIQACRNAWTACGLQHLLGAQAEITSSILGYSLLYPYSDNYLDRPDLSNEKKLRFSERFEMRLRGEKLSAENPREFAIWTMVRLIEQQYPRLSFPDVFDCMLAIHHAQVLSLAQLKSRFPRSDDEILRISCAKGGTSVLADACLIRGSINQQETRLAFEWGVLLQLGDDLQDVRDDLQRGCVTLFTRKAANGTPLDSLVIQLLNYTSQVADRIDASSHGSDALKKLLRMSWNSLIHMAVADAYDFFSPAFVSELERRSPFRFEFLRARNKKLARRRGLYSKLFDVLLEQREREEFRVALPDYRLKTLRKAELALS
jgi:hypothetical protein